MEEKKREVVYNSAKKWQIGFFALNNTATNMYMFLMMFVSFYATGIAGLLVVAVSSVITFSRILDGLTDPIIGFVMDRTETKIGKFRPFMILGNVVLASTVLIMFITTHHVPESMRFFYFVAIYVVYIIGYTFQTCSTRAAQTALTNDPKQRPLFSLFDAIYNTALFIGLQFVLSTYWVPKHGGFTMGLFKEMLTVVIIGSAIMTTLAVIAIWNKDVKENWGLATAEKIKFSEYLPILKANRPLQMLVVAASTDKLAGSVRSNAVTTVIIYGILMSNYALSGQIGLVTTIPTILITFIGINYARKLGQKKAFVVGTWACIVLNAALLLFFVTADITAISFSGFNVTTLIFLAIMSLTGGSQAVSGNIVIPMIADCSDYETYRSGKYVPGMIATIFSFVDKLISSLAATIVGFMVAMIGFKEAFPTVDTPYSSALMAMGLFFFIGIPMLGWIASLIAMKFYKLDGEKMKEVQQFIAENKANVAA